MWWLPVPMVMGSASPVSTQCRQSVVEFASLMTVAILITRPQAGTNCWKLY